MFWDALYGHRCGAYYMTTEERQWDSRFPCCHAPSQAKSGPLLLLGMQVNMDSEGVESTANVTDIHEPLHFDITEERDSGYRCGIARPLWHRLP